MADDFILYPQPNGQWAKIAATTTSDGVATVKVDGGVGVPSDVQRPPTAEDDTSRGMAADYQWTAPGPVRTWRCTTPALLAARWRGVDFGNVIPGAWLSGTNLAGLYGVMQLTPGYSGNLFRVVSSAGGTPTLDAAQVARELPNGRRANAYDGRAIDDFLGANSGSIDTLYDQSGLGRNMTQATLANRPQWSKNRVGYFNSITFSANQSNAVNPRWIQYATPGTLTRGNMGVIMAIRNRASFAQSCLFVGNPGAVGGSQARFQLGLGVAIAPQLAMSSGPTTNDLSGLVAPSDEAVVGMVTTTTPSNLLTMWTNSRRATVARAITNATLTGWNFGTDGTVGAAISHFDLLAAIVYTRALTDAEQQDATAILAELCGIPLQPPPNRIVHLGDSIVMGVGSVFNRNRVYFEEHLYKGKRTENINLGVGGRQLASDLADVALITSTAYSSLVPRTVFVIQSCGADLLAGRTGAQTYADLVALTTALRALGPSVKVVASTTSPAIDPPATASVQAQGAIYRDLLLANAGLFDGVVDIIGDPTMGNGNQGNTALYGDGIHPTELGYNYLAQLYARVTEPLLVS